MNNPNFAHFAFPPPHISDKKEIRTARIGIPKFSSVTAFT